MDYGAGDPACGVKRPRLPKAGPPEADRPPDTAGMSE